MARLCDGVGCQAFSLSDFANCGDRLAHSMVTFEQCFVFAEFDAEIAALHQVIQPAHILDGGVGTLAAEIAGTVKPGTGFGAKRVWAEALRSEIGTPEISPGQTISTKIELAKSASWNQFTVAIKNVSLCVGNGFADCHCGIGTHARVSCIGGRFGRTVQVIDAANLRVLVEITYKRVWQRFSCQFDG